MMEEESRQHDDQTSPGRLTLSSLVFSSFAVGTPGILTGLLLIEIGATFGVPVGIMGQVRTASSTMVIVASLLISVASTRYTAKALLMFGILSLLTSAIGCAFAQSYIMMLLLYPLTGIGMATIQPMALTLIAEYFPLERRARAVGWYVAGGSLAYVVGSQAIVFLARRGGWRAAYLGFVAPVVMMSFVLAWIGLPKLSVDNVEGDGGFMRGFRGVLMKRSAVSCLFATVLRLASFQLILLYGTSFFREEFVVSRELASTIITVVALSYTAGSIVVGRLVDRYGRRRLTLATTFLAASFTILMTLSPDFILALLFDFLSAWFFGMSASVAHSLNLEQVPEFRGIMMSLNSASGGLGAALGAGIGGFVLLTYGYGTSGITLGGLGVVSALIYLFLTTDPSAS